MTQDEIIEMANQSELCHCIWIDDEGPEIASLVDFAKLVAAKEREACAFVSEDCGAIHVAKRIRARGEA
jgi:hypothetical protein